jgi:hypothetical protein
VSDTPIQNVFFRSSVPTALRVTSVSPSDSTTFSNNFVTFQISVLNPHTSVIVTINTIAQVSSEAQSVTVPGTVQGTQNTAQNTVVVSLSATSPTITILPVGGLPVTGGNIAPVLMGIGILAMAFLGVRLTNRVRRFRNVKRRR